MTHPYLSILDDLQQLIKNLDTKFSEYKRQSEKTPSTSTNKIDDKSAATVSVAKNEVLESANLHVQDSIPQEGLSQSIDGPSKCLTSAKKRGFKEDENKENPYE